MRPLIGINCEIDAPPGNPPKAQLDLRYVEAVERAGGMPVLFSPLKDLGEVEEVLSRIDGLVLSGGDDLDPRLYGEEEVHPKAALLPKEKETFDLALARAAAGRGIPTLGICYGMQLLSVAFGGSLHQHVPDAVRGAGEHRKADHAVRIEPGCRLREILACDTILVRSSHHQSVREAPKGWRITARAEDGIVEAIEPPGRGFLLGVQWHPEREPMTPSLFQALVEEARRRQGAP